MSVNFRNVNTKTQYLGLKRIPLTIMIGLSYPGRTIQLKPDNYTTYPMRHNFRGFKMSWFVIILLRI